MHATHATTSSNLFFPCSQTNYTLHSFPFQIGCNELNALCNANNARHALNDLVENALEKKKTQLRDREKEKELALSYLEQRANCKSLQRRHALPVSCLSTFNFHFVLGHFNSLTLYLHMLVSCSVASYRACRWRLCRGYLCILSQFLAAVACLFLLYDGCSLSLSRSFYLSLSPSLRSRILIA